MDTTTTVQRAWLSTSAILGVAAIEILILLTDAARGEPLGTATLAGAGLAALCCLALAGITWAQRVLVAALCVRAIPLSVAVASSFGPGEVFRPGALCLFAFYVGAVLVLASPIGQATSRAGAGTPGATRVER
jgi:hypothetical protein